MTNYEPDADVFKAAENLVGRTGAKNLTFGYLHDDVPMEEMGWYAKAQYPGAVIMVENQPSPDEALVALCERVLTGAQCQRCGGLVQLRDDGAMAYPDAPRPDGTRWTKEEIESAGMCRWQREGPQWDPSCTLPPAGDDEVHTAEKLALTLEELGDPRLKPIMWKARRGYYHDYLSPLAAPSLALVIDLRALDHHAMARRVANGEFDASLAESDAWRNSDDGQRVFAELVGTSMFNEFADAKRREHPDDQPTAPDTGSAPQWPSTNVEQATGAAFWFAQRNAKQNPQ